MSTAKNLVKLSADELIALRKQGIKQREIRLSTANSKGRRIGFLGAEYAQRQNSQYLRQHTSEDIAVALYKAGIITMWKDDLRGMVFAFTDDEGNVPDDFQLPSVTEIESMVRENLEDMEAPKKTRSK